MKSKKIIKAIAFFAAVVLAWGGLQSILQPKWMSEPQTYARVKYFYQEDPKPEVVFIGSSVLYRSVNPIQLFKEHGIASYDFAPANQSMEVTKLYVEEAIRVACPRMIIIEPMKIMDLTYDETRARWWLDPVPLSVSKIKTVKEIMEHNQEYGQGLELGNMASWAFPIFRYHDRWKELKSEDFGLDQKNEFYHGARHYHGYGPRYFYKKADFSKYYDSVDFSDALIREAKTYFADIVELCKENDVQLILMKTPSPYWRQDYHDLVQSWAEEYDVVFLDYNEEMDEIGIDIETDFIDAEVHLNDNGSTKVTSYLGQYLQTNYDLPDHRGDSGYAEWEKDWQVYKQDRASYYLAQEKDWSTYLEKLQDSNYTIYIAVRDSLGGDKHPELTEQLKNLGLTPQLDTAARMGYMAVIDSGEVAYEHLEDAPVSHEFDLNDHHVSLASESYKQGNRASIQLDWVERFVNHRGVGIVVYDKVLDDVVDSVTFDLWDGGKAYR